MKAVLIGESPGASMDEILAVYPRDSPFALEGLVKSYTIRDWNDTLIPE